MGGWAMSFDGKTRCHRCWTKVHEGAPGFPEWDKTTEEYQMDHAKDCYTDVLRETWVRDTSYEGFVLDAIGHDGIRAGRALECDPWGGEPGDKEDAADRMKLAQQAPAMARMLLWLESGANCPWCGKSAIHEPECAMGQLCSELRTLEKP
jgi:hypothetical protein